MAELLLERAARRCEGAEVYAVETDRTMVQFRADELEAVQTSATRGVGLRVIHAGRIGFSSSTAESPGPLPGCAEHANGHDFDLLDAAIETAAFGKKARFDLPGAVIPAPVAACDNRVVMLPDRKVVEWGRDLVEAVRARVPQLKLYLAFRRSYREVSIRNTAGLGAEFARAEFDLVATGLLVQDGLAWITEYENLSDGRPLNIEALANRLERRARSSRRRSAVSRGVWPVVVMPAALRALLEPVAAGVNGRHLADGITPLAGRIGESVLDARLTIADNPLRSYGLESAPIDGEGVARRRQMLFEQGVFQGFLFDLATAAAGSASGTGSARRSYDEPPLPGVSNVELEPGTTRLEDAVGGIREGLVVDEVIGAGQSNIMAGEVAVSVVSGNKIENGAVAGWVKGVCLAGNIYEMLRSVEAVGDQQQDLGDAFLPFVVFPGLRLEPGA